MDTGLPHPGGTSEPWYPEFIEALSFKHNWVPIWPVFVCSPSWGQADTLWSNAPTAGQVWCGHVPPKFLLLDYPVWPKTTRFTKILTSGMTFQGLGDYLVEAKGKVSFRKGWILYYIPWKVSKSHAHSGGEEMVSIFLELSPSTSILDKLFLEQIGY